MNHRSSFHTWVVALVVVGSVVAMGVAEPALAGPRLNPVTFVGKAGDCGSGYPAGARIAAADWVQGLGLPDRGADNFNTSDPADLPAKQDKRYGVLLSKNGNLAVCSAAAAEVNKLGTIVIDSTTHLGFDIRTGSYCSGGAPRFNVYTDQGFAFVGPCSAGVQSPAPQDPSQWTRVRYTLTGFGLPVGATIERIDIIFDEQGFAILDNIDIDGTLISGPSTTIDE
jgi:hypothetical protein